MSDDVVLPPAAAWFSPGSRVAAYRLEEQIGRGGMAAVFRAHDERHDRQVALKILAPGLAEDPVFRKRFIRESLAAAGLDDPHIIPVFEAGDADDVLFIAMRLVHGGDLRSLVRRDGPLPPARAGEIVIQMASALDAAHEAGLVHRDVKPANMLLDARRGRRDHVYLSDFGLTRPALGSTGLTGSGQFLGTVDYAAPEQIEGQVIDGRADQYALACSAFELLCGERLFRRDHEPAVAHAHLYEPPPSLVSRQPVLPGAVDGVFAKALAKSAAGRYATCQEFALALRSALALQPGMAEANSGHQDPAANVARQVPASDKAADLVTPAGGIRSPGQGESPPAGAKEPRSARCLMHSAASHPDTSVPDVTSPMNQDNHPNRRDQPIPGPRGGLSSRELTIGLLGSLMIVLTALPLPLPWKAGSVAFAFAAGLALIYLTRAALKTAVARFGLYGALVAGIAGGLLAGHFLWPRNHVIATPGPTRTVIKIAPTPPGPPPASTVKALLADEAATAKANDPAGAIRLYAPVAFVRDAACTSHGQPQTWHGLDRVLKRYLTLPRFSSLRHADVTVTIKPDNARATSATAVARTTGFIKRSRAFPQGQALGGYELWTFRRVNGIWMITSFTYDLCARPGAGG